MAYGFLGDNLINRLFKKLPQNHLERLKSVKKNILLLPIQCGHVYSFLAIFFQEGKEKRKESKKDHSDENEEEIQKAPEEVKKKSTGGFTKSMHKTFGQKFSPKGKRIMP